MKTFDTPKTIQLAVLLTLFALALGCGYSKNTMPVQPGTAPAVAQLAPSSAAAGGAAFMLEVDGTNFASKAVINFNGVAQATTFVSATKLQATIPAAAIMNTATVPVTVTNPAVSGGIYGGGTMAATSAPMNFAIN